MTADATLLHKDLAARDDALDVSRSFIVQAPAGSGKTELLIQRYLCLLAVVEHPEEVLAITFTRKAAEEMRVRVLDALRKARDGVAAESRHEQKTQNLAQAALVRDSDNEWHLVESPGRMRIETVDAFGAGIARSLPLSSGLGGARSTVADAEIETVYREAAAATLDYLADNDDNAGVVERVLDHLDNNTGLYIAYLSRMLGSREQWLTITGSGIRSESDANAARRQLEANIADVVTRQLSTIVSLLPPIVASDLPALLSYAGENLVAEGRGDHRLARFAGTEALPSVGAVDREGWQGIADLLLTQKGDWRKQVTKNDGFPPGNKEPKDALGEIIAALREVAGLRPALARCRLLPEPRYEDGQWKILLALFELLPLAVAELRRLFGERGVTDHNEVAIAAGRALGSSEQPGEIALMLDYQVRHLLVDEMQDTSIAQYELLRKLTEGWQPGDGRTVFCVGDPMQSIYRFRDAEVGEFLVAREKGIGSVALDPLTLRQNFRSGENLVHWFNTVFSQVMPLHDDIAVGAISYAESVPIADKSGQGHCEVHALFNADQECESVRAVEVIRQIQDDNPGDSMAVLVRSRAHLSALLPQLRVAGIDYQAVEIERLTDLPEIIDLIALTRAMCHEGDRLAWLALLRSPTVGLLWSDLHALVMNDSHSTITELCADAERLEAVSEDGRRRIHGFMDCTAAFRQSSRVTSLRERVELAWHAIGGPALLADEGQLENVYRFLATIDRLSVAGTLTDVRELERRLDEEKVSSASDGQCALQIMTMHKAKGLQFDHVILPSLGRGTRGGNREVLSWLSLPDTEGRNEMIISPVGPRSTLENDPLYRLIDETEKDKNRMEHDRLLYVACTRARRSLHLVASVGITRDGESLRRPDSRSLLSRLWPAVELHFERGFGDYAESPAVTDGDEEAIFAYPVLRRMQGDWSPPGAASLPGLAQDGKAVADEPEVDYYWVGSAARHAGTIVHRWLHRISDAVISIAPGQAGDLRATSRRWATLLGVPDSELDPVCDRVESALNGILGDEKGQWLLNGDGHAELALSGVVDDRVESVVIDRVRIDEDGTHWIIDYKTSTHEGGDLEGFLGQERDRYRPQLLRYAAIYAALTNAPVRTALYFPLLQAFTEVGPEA